MNMVRGVLAKTGKPASLHPGDMPEDAAKLLDVARKGEQVWLDDGFALMEFLPPALTLTDGMGPPHIRLDRALEFLIGDKL